MTRVWSRIAQRCALEFGPPAVAAVAWNWYAGTLTVVGFSAAFTAIGLFWLSLLRIQYQQTVRVKQEETATQLVQLTEDVQRANEALTNINKVVASLGPTIPAKQAEEISTAVNKADDLLKAANAAASRAVINLAKSLTAHALRPLLRDPDGQYIQALPKRDGTKPPA